MRSDAIGSQPAARSLRPAQTAGLATSRRATLRRSDLPDSAWKPIEAIGLDRVSAAVRSGFRAGHAEACADQSLLAHAVKVASPSWAESPQVALEVLLGLVTSFPTCERLQSLAATALQTCDPHRAAEAWKAVHERFPFSAEVFRRYMRWVARDVGRDAALRILLARFPTLPTDVADLKLFAWGSDELRTFEQSDRAFRLLLERPGGNEAVSLEFARSLFRRSELVLGCEVLRDAQRAGAGARVDRTLAEAEARQARLATLAPLHRHARASDTALEAIFTTIAKQRRPVRRDRKILGRVILLTGSLAAGGAERQLALTARALKDSVGRVVNGVPVRGPVEVICRSLMSRVDGDFFKPILERAGIPVSEYEQFEPLGGSGPASITAPYTQLLEYLPQPVSEGLVQLADHLRARAPHVVHIWQDGAIFAAGLAALMAGVPRIVLTVRGLPPVDRPERWKPEYEIFYRSLLRAPGVRLLANSRAAARRYEEWLALRRGSVGVIFNGVDALPTTALPTDEQLWHRFDARTGDADFTVGSTMRLDENKRSLLWLDTAAAVLAHAPKARFVIVGDGPLRADCKARAIELGIDDRVLFVGRSVSVGYWLTKMDAFLLLSLTEGLPNVLVEAQHAGLPVVATAAGGAAETIDAGRSGIVLPAGPGLQAAAAAAPLLALRADPERRLRMGRAACAWAQKMFSVEAMADATVNAFVAS